MLTSESQSQLAGAAGSYPQLRGTRFRRVPRPIVQELLRHASANVTLKLNEGYSDYRELLGFVAIVSEEKYLEGGLTCSGVI